jgi:DNA-binding transcriptional LysR family regulator
VIEALEPHAVHFVCRPGHPLARQKNLELAQLLEYPIVAGYMGGDAAHFAHISGASGHFDADTGDFRPTIQVNSMGLAREIVIHSDALLPATFSMVQEEIDVGRLMLLDAEPVPIPARPCQFYRRGRTPSPAALTFMEILREADAEIAAAESGWVRRSTRRSKPGKRKQ